MNDFSELEAELKKLRPAPVAPELWRRIERGLALPDQAPTAGLLPRKSKSATAWWSLGLGLAAASVAILAGLAFFAEPPTSQPTLAQTSPRSTEPPRSGLQPSALTRVVYRQHDDGLVFSPNQSERLLRRVRYETRETMQWRNPQTGASLRVSYPAEQVVLTPVSFQ
jgi:hypothetical protein